MTLSVIFSAPLPSLVELLFSRTALKQSRDRDIPGLRIKIMVENGFLR